MHSSKLRGNDFSITCNGVNVSHAQFFADFKATDRVGLLAPDRLDGLGAGILIMAYVTAFYDRYREKGDEFFAYPDFFSFQEIEPVADYGWFDISPHHKDILIGGEQDERAASITDRAVDILLVPEGRTQSVSIKPVEIESARRNIQRCFIYSPSGCAADAEIAISCNQAELGDWTRKILNSVPESAGDSNREYWENTLQAGGLPEQQFREISLDQALAAI